jgi:hypothetical protein
MANCDADIELSAFADGELKPATAHAVAGRLDADAASRRALAVYRKLDEAAARLPAPELSDAAARVCWRKIAEFTTALTAADRRAFARLDQAAAALPVAMPPVEAFERVRESILEQIARSGAEVRDAQAAVRGAEPPAVSAQQWDQVWQGIRRKAKLDAAVPAAEARVVRADFSRARSFRGAFLAAASLAAAVLLGAFVFLLPRGGDDQVAVLEVPQALDGRYEVHVAYVDGQAEPVVCFFLKDDTGAGEKNGQDWRWLPD